MYLHLCYKIVIVFNRKKIVYATLVKTIIPCTVIMFLLERVYTYTHFM